MNSSEDKSYIRNLLMPEPSSGEHVAPNSNSRAKIPLNSNLRLWPLRTSLSIPKTHSETIPVVGQYHQFIAPNTFPLLVQTPSEDALQSRSSQQPPVKHFARSVGRQNKSKLVVSQKAKILKKVRGRQRQNCCSVGRPF